MGKLSKPLFCIYLDVDYLKNEILEMDQRLEGVIDNQQESGKVAIYLYHKQEN